MVRSTSLAPGIQVVTHSSPAMHSAALGLWLVNGARHQSPAEHGYAHLLEHLLFKGTADLDARALALRCEAMGGNVNAQTGRELTTYYGVVPADQLTDLATLLLGMLLTPRFDAADLKLEREVVFAEMAMVRENPEERLEEDAVAAAWPDHPMGWPILGERRVLRAAQVGDLRRYLAEVLAASELWVVAAGNLDHDELVAACAPLAALERRPRPAPSTPTFVPGTRRVALAELGQSHLLWAMPAPAAGGDDAALGVADHVLGGGVSSRLFQEVRERRGLAYGIQSRVDRYGDTGLWLIDTACDPDRAGETRAAVEAVLRELAADGPDAEELATARSHIRARLLTDADDAETAMERLAHDVIYRGRALGIDERLARLAAVDNAAVRGLLAHATRAPLHWEYAPRD